MYSEQTMQEFEDGLESSHHIETACQIIRRKKKDRNEEKL